MALYPVILAGGSGTRLWPLSRELYPKPFLSLTGDRSLFQEAIHRLEGIEGVSPAVVVCNEEHRFLVAEHMRELGKSPLSIILEPVGRNTAPALALAALMLADECKGSDAEDPVMLVMPADHVIRDAATFRSAVRLGAVLAEGECLVTFGIVPTSAKTGYGYIKRGSPYQRAEAGQTSSEVTDNRPLIAPFLMEAFVEKPDRTTAEQMLQSGDYLWNSGMFIMRASVWLEQLRRYRPDIADACRTAYAQGHRDGTFYRPDPEVFAACPSDTIDYAVMEKVGAVATPDASDAGPSVAADGLLSAAPECVLVPLAAGWSDIGAWSALWEVGEQDKQGNVTQGDVIARSMRDSLLIGQHRLLAAVGLDNVIAVETADAVLVAHKDHVQDVKGLVEQLKLENRQEQANHRKVHRPWGSYETVDRGQRFQVKRLTVNPGASLSLQLHHHRAEHWIVVRGTAKVTKGDEEFLLTENKSTDVPVGTKHRLENPGTVPLEIIEVQSGDYLEEDDIVRLEDRYERHKERRPPAR